MFHMGNSQLAPDHQICSGDGSGDKFSVSQECHAVKKAYYRLGCIDEAVVFKACQRLFHLCSAQWELGCIQLWTLCSKYRECAQKGNRMIRVILTFLVWESPQVCVVFSILKTSHCLKFSLKREENKEQRTNKANYFRKWREFFPCSALRASQTQLWQKLYRQLWLPQAEEEICVIPVLHKSFTQETSR